MSSGYLLGQRGINYRILEATTTYGGRIKRTTTFADFPIPLGAEWLHVPDSELRSIVNNPAVEVTTRTVGYKAEDSLGYFENGVLTTRTMSDWGEIDPDLKFVGSTWFDFFREFIVPHVEPRMTFDTPVVAIDYEGDGVSLTDAYGVVHQADAVIVTAPLRILQLGEIAFSPPLPDDRQEALADAVVWGGIKVFFEFSEQFFPTILNFSDTMTNQGQRLYYDAAYGQNSSSSVLGLFAVGAQALPYQALSGNAQRDYILAELDQVFGGLASRTYVKHLVQNWNDEPFAKGAYLADEAPSRISQVLSGSIAGKVFFAGDAYTKEDDWSAVHNAARSARDVVQEMVG
ncbi:MAG: monoamine oxidase [Rhodothermales bacterium]|jgi:monoamine oxidase